MACASVFTFALLKLSNDKGNYITTFITNSKNKYSEQEKVFDSVEEIGDNYKSISLLG
jgi:hypothetical protein